MRCAVVPRSRSTDETPSLLYVTHIEVNSKSVYFRCTMDVIMAKKRTIQ